VIFDITKYIDNLELQFRGDENKWLRVSMQLQVQLEQALRIISETNNKEFCEKFVTGNNKRLPARCGEGDNMEYDWETSYSPADSEIISDEKRRIDSAGYWLDSVLERLYDASSELDEFSLACDLDELCHLLDVKRKPGILQVERKQTKVTQFLHGLEA
jgi:hypothetical protein